MALVLAAHAPSGAAAIVSARARLAGAMFHSFDCCSASAAPAAVRHTVAPVLAVSPSCRYVGSGLIDCQQRPSLWANPFFFLGLEPHVALARFADFLNCRCDLHDYLFPLAGCVLLCDCSLGPFCHAILLARLTNERFSALSELEPCPSVPKTGSAPGLAPALCPVPAFPAPPFDDDCVDFADDSNDESPPRAGRCFEDLRNINETVRGGRFDTGKERPSWRPAWFSLIQIVRAAPILLFWEIFSGVAGLTSEFLRQGWSAAPPIDVIDCADFDCLDPAFVAVLLGLILERRFRLIHLGPPCSSFSMACNRFLKYAMRSAAFPAGLAGLLPHQLEKVSLGNALATVAAHLIDAQCRAGGLWTLEQPTSSLMWLFAPIAEIMARLQAIMVKTDVCFYGAPWKKPTTVATNHQPLLTIANKCRCKVPHLVLQGNAPGGKSWTAIASPYWPGYQSAWVAAFACARPGPTDLIPAPSHLAGFVVTPGSWSMETVLDSMGFQQPKSKFNFVAAMRTCAGVQPAGRSMPTLLPEGIGPESHLAIALRATHPMARPVVLPRRCQLAIESQPDDPTILVTRRSVVVKFFLELADLCLDENNLLLGYVHPNVLHAAKSRNLAFMREISFICGGCDHNLFVDYVFGLPMHGLARHSTTLMQRSSRPPAMPASDAELVKMNDLVLSRVKSTGDLELDEAAHVKTMAEFEKGTMIGPFLDIASLPAGRRRFLPRFPIRERHGGAVDFSVRLIDDCRISGVNDESGTSSAHRPVDLDAWVCLIRAIGLKWISKLLGFTSDFKGAYRQVPSCPLQALEFIVVFWDAARKAQGYGIATCQLFGSGNSPLNFCRYPDWVCTVLSCLLAIPADHCVDDILSLERAISAYSGYSAWRAFARVCGWDVPDEKSPPPAACFRTLGAITDLTDFPGGVLRLRVSPERVEAISSDLKGILLSGFLKPAFAGKLFGKMSFMASQFYGRLGKALLRAFSRRQHDRGHVGLNPQLKAACLHWVQCLPTLRPREIPLDLSALPVAVSYSDGEGADAGIGVALWLPGQRARAGYLQAPIELRRLWARARKAEAEFLDIFEIEAVGPAIVLSNWGHDMQGMLWLHFIDNEAALASLVKGSSSVMSGEVISSFTHSLVAHYSLMPWFDRVDSKSNPVDGLSRNDFRGDWDLVPIHFPPVLTSRLNEFLAV